MAKKTKAKSARASGMKTAKKSKGKVQIPRRPRQAALPEMEQPRNARIEAAARDYADARDERMRVGEEEQRRHKKLLAVMHAEGVKVYKHRTGTEVIEVALAAKDATEKAKVKIYDADEGVRPERKSKRAQPDIDTDTPLADQVLDGTTTGDALESGVE